MWGLGLASHGEVSIGKHLFGLQCRGLLGDEPEGCERRVSSRVSDPGQRVVGLGERNDHGDGAKLY